MPIDVRPEDDSPLSQGDILRKVSFVLADSAGIPVLDTQVYFVLVVSRPCKALRDEAVTVAPVVPFPLDLKSLIEGKPSGLGLDQMRRIMAGIRDGGQYSDSFYLGALQDSSNKRFAAQLTRLSTVMVP